MTIAIDASRANKQLKTGTEWYSYHIIQELKKIASSEARFVLYSNTKLKDGLEKLPESFEERVLSWPPKYLWTQIRLWWELFFNPPEVLFVPAHTIPFLPLRRKTKVVVTVHDVGFKRFPTLYKKIQVWYHDLTMRRIRSRANLILTDSEFSKREIADLYGVSPEKIQVIYLGYDQDKFFPREVDDNALQKYKIKKPYLLFIGRLESKKNIFNILQSFFVLKEKYPQLQLVLEGACGYGWEAAQELINNSQYRDDVVVTGYVPGQDLANLLLGANVFLFPTLYEGFGLPILEAMAAGVPVLISNINPHLEIAAGAAPAADPYDPADMADKISGLLSNQQLIDDVRAAGLRRAADFSWEKSGRETGAAILELGRRA